MLTAPTPRPSTPHRRRLIVTADDVGLRSDWDRACFATAQQGVVTCVSVVTNGPTYRDVASELLRSGVDHGVHLNLLCSSPLSPRNEVASLVGAGGRLSPSVGEFVLRYALGRVALRDVAREWERQIQRAFDDGLSPSFLNAHYHLHALPGLFQVAADLAEKFGIRWLRLPDEPSDLGAPWPGVARSRLLSALSRAGVQQLRRRGVGTVPCRGVARSGRLDERALRGVVERLGDGVTEIVCHPGQGRAETRALASSELGRWIAEQAERCTFRDLDPEDIETLPGLDGPLLVVMPAYNEAENLPHVLHALLAARPGTDVLVVDDGSSDATAAVARAAGAEVVSHPENRGYGAALVTGYRHALARGHGRIVQLDADGQHDPSDIVSLLEPIERGEADIVFGSRMLPGGGHQTSLPRSIGIHAFAWLGRRLSERQITDPTSGFAAMNARAADFLALATPRDFPDLNVLLALERAGLRVSERPVTMAPRRSGRSQLRGLAPLVYVPKMLFYIWCTERAFDRRHP